MRVFFFRFKITQRQAEAGVHYSFQLWALYMAVSMPGHDDLIALHYPEQAS